MKTGYSRAMTEVGAGAGSGFSPAANSRLIKWLLLGIVLVLAFIMAGLPRWQYPYPLHIDEWLHLAYSRAIQVAGSTAVTSVPLYEYHESASGENVTKVGDVEPAFHILWGILQQVTDISWLAIFRWFPGLIFVLVVFAVYVLARRNGYGLEAAFLSSLMPTNVTILGPSLLVPVSLAMLFLPLSLLLIFNYRTKAAYAVLFIFMSFLVLLHLPTAVILTVVVASYTVLNARENWKHSLAVAIAVISPLMAFSPLILRTAPGFAESFTGLTYLPSYLPYLPNLILFWGYLLTFLFAIGVYLLIRKGGAPGYSLVLASFLLLLHNLVFIIWHRGIQIIYHRGYLYLMLLMSIVGGYALWRMRRFSVPDTLTTRFKTYTSSWNWLRSVLLVIVIGLTLVEATSHHLQTPFYHMIDEQDYAAFVWVEQNLPEIYDKAILDPWKATAFMALARRDVYTRIHHAPQEADDKAYNFLHDGCRDTSFLTENNISIVYSREEVDNDSLIRLKDDIYILSKD